MAHLPEDDPQFPTKSIGKVCKRHAPHRTPSTPCILFLPIWLITPSGRPRLADVPLKPSLTTRGHVDLCRVASALCSH
ncbi:putative leader peptide [Spirillospora sp. NPDC048832]